jgi:hypothetical protein
MLMIHLIAGARLRDERVRQFPSTSRKRALLRLAGQGGYLRPDGVVFTFPREYTGRIVGRSEIGVAVSDHPRYGLHSRRIGNDTSEPQSGHKGSAEFAV